jgi:hypothetical protein
MMKKLLLFALIAITFSQCKYNDKEFNGVFVGNYVDFSDNNKVTDCVYVFYTDFTLNFYNHHDPAKATKVYGGNWSITKLNKLKITYSVIGSSETRYDEATVSLDLKAFQGVWTDVVGSKKRGIMTAFKP